MALNRCACCLSIEASPTTENPEGVQLVTLWTLSRICQICTRDAVGLHAEKAKSNAGDRPPWPGRYLALRSGKEPIIPCDTIPAPPPSGVRA